MVIGYVLFSLGVVKNLSVCEFFSVATLTLDCGRQTLIQWCVGIC